MLTLLDLFLSPFPDSKRVSLPFLHFLKLENSHHPVGGLA